MKPLWTQTLAWILAVLAAVVLAMASPGGMSQLFDTELFPHGASTPR